MRLSEGTIEELETFVAAEKKKRERARSEEIIVSSATCAGSLHMKIDPMGDFNDFRMTVHSGAGDIIFDACPDGNALRAMQKMIGSDRTFDA